MEQALASSFTAPSNPAASLAKGPEHQGSVSKVADSSADTIAPTDASAASETKEDLRQEATAVTKDCFDPPKQVAKSEQKRKFPSGNVCLLLGLVCHVMHWKGRVTQNCTQRDVWAQTCLDRSFLSSDQSISK